MVLATGAFQTTEKEKEGLRCVLDNSGSRVALSCEMTLEMWLKISAQFVA